MDQADIADTLNLPQFNGYFKKYTDQLAYQ